MFYFYHRARRFLPILLKYIGISILRVLAALALAVIAVLFLIIVNSVVRGAQMWVSVTMNISSGDAALITVGLMGVFIGICFGIYYITVMSLDEYQRKYKSKDHSEPITFSSLDDTQENRTIKTVATVWQQFVMKKNRIKSDPIIALDEDFAALEKKKRE